MFDKFIKTHGLFLLNEVFSDYMGTQFFPSKFFANDILSNEELKNIYSKSISKPINNLYIHIPFCKTGCFYCHCFKYVGDNLIDQYDKYTDYLLKEIDYNYKLFGQKMRIDSIFIGGGTPNIIGDDNLKRILQKIKDTFDLSQLKQFNIDLNPYFFTESLIDILSGNGINRCTFAVQSFDTTVLNENSRFNIKDFDYVSMIKKLQNSGIFVNIDLMIGIKGQTLESTINDINKCVEYGVDNISLNYLIQSANIHYVLDDEKKELIRKVKKHFNKFVNDKYNKSSNFQEDSYLKNNANLIGIGNGAITHLYGNLMSYNLLSLKDYYDGLDNGDTLKINYKKLNLRDEAIKYLWFNLIYSVDRQKFKDIAGEDICILFKEEIDYLTNKKIIEIDNNSVKPIVNNFELYLNLTIFLSEYIDTEKDIKIDTIKVLTNLKKFFLNNLEKIDEDY